MQNRLGRKHEHRERGRGERPQRQRRPVDEHAAKHQRDHHERALGRDLGARQHQIAGGAGERDPRRPFLDRPPEREPRDQREQAAHDREDRARHQRHVQAGDRQHVIEAGDAHGLVDLERDRVADAGDERDRDRAALSRQHLLDALGQSSARALDRRVETNVPRHRHAGGDVFRLSEHEAGGAEAREIGAARIVVAAGPRRAQERPEPRAQLHVRAHHRRGAAPERDPHPLGRGLLAARHRLGHAQDYSVRALGGVAAFHEPGERDRAGGAGQDRVRDHGRPQRRGGKAGGEKGERKRDREGGRILAAHPDGEEQRDQRDAGG